MEVLYTRCCGLDVHQRLVVACLSLVEAGLRRKEVRTFGTTTRELISMRNWLIEAGCTHVAMESTGVYWRPIYQRLFGFFELVVANAQHLKAVEGTQNRCQRRRVDCRSVATWVTLAQFSSSSGSAGAEAVDPTAPLVDSGEEPISQPYPQAVAGGGNQAHLRTQRRDGGRRHEPF